MQIEKTIFPCSSGRGASSASPVSSSSISIFAKFRNANKDRFPSDCGNGNLFSSSPSSNRNNDFTREVILLLKKHQCKPLTDEQIEEYQDAKLAFQTVHLNKEWSHSKLLATAYALFDYRLPSDACDLEFMRPVGDRLRKFYPEPGRSIDGRLIFNYSKQFLYVRPSIYLNIDLDQKSVQKTQAGKKKQTAPRKGIQISSDSER